MPTLMSAMRECGPVVVTPSVLLLQVSFGNLHLKNRILNETCFNTSAKRTSLRSISNGQLNTSRHLHLHPIYPVVFGGPLEIFTRGYLILRRASRLDAFSVYPIRIWPSCHGAGTPTGPPVIRPSRSSRTKDSSLQISYACAG